MRFKLRKTCLCIFSYQFLLFLTYSLFFYGGEEIDITPHTRDLRASLTRDIILPTSNSTFHVVTFHTGHHNQTLTSDNISHVHSKCADIVCPVDLAMDNTWALVNNDHSAIIFSSYYMDSTASMVIIGARVRSIRSRQASRSYMCQLWFTSADGSNAIMEESSVACKDMPEHHGKGYAATQFHCPVPSRKRPSFISMVTKSCQYPTNLIRVRQTTVPDKYNRQFTVCLTPLHFNYSKAFELVEWIELNRLLGADKFTVYNFSSAKNVADVLEYYSKRGLVEAVQWDVLVSATGNKSKIKHFPDIHYYGQVVALQECLYRNKHESEFVANLDLDEFVIPREDNVTSWSQMLARINKGAGAFIFKNTFFKKEWADTEDDFPNKIFAQTYKLVTLLKTKHEEKVFGYRQRSKYFARTSLVNRLHIHDVPGLGKNGVAKAELVPEEKAMLHHYRNWLQTNESEKIKVKDDIVVRNYASKLIANVRTVWKHLPNTPDEM